MHIIQVIGILGILSITITQMAAVLALAFRKKFSIDQHITILGGIYIVFNAFPLLPLAIFLSLGIVFLSQDPEDSGMLIGTAVAAILLMAFSLLGILTGIGLLKRRRWARISAIGLGILNFFLLGIGVGAYMIWALFEEETKKRFAADDKSSQKLIISSAVIGVALITLTTASVLWKWNRTSPYRTANAYLNQGKLDDAIAEYKKAVRINPNFAKVHLNLGNIYYNQGKYDEAIESYQIAISIDQNYALAHNNLGIAYGRQGKLDKAIAEYKRVIEIDPNYAKAYNNLGFVYLRQGKLNNAIVEYKKAIEIDPDDASAHNYLGIVYRRQGKLDKAIAECKKAIEIDPNYETAHYNIACYYSLKNEKTSAIESFQKAITLDRKWIEYSKTDSDFDNIRSSPEFQQLIKLVE